MIDVEHETSAPHDVPLAFVNVDRSVAVLSEGFCPACRVPVEPDHYCPCCMFTWSVHDQGDCCLLTASAERSAPGKPE